MSMRRAFVRDNRSAMKHVVRARLCLEMLEERLPPGNLLLGPVQGAAGQPASRPSTAGASLTSSLTTDPLTGDLLTPASESEVADERPAPHGRVIQGDLRETDPIGWPNTVAQIIRAEADTAGGTASAATTHAGPAAPTR